jgi:hypothetical protein
MDRSSRQKIATTRLHDYFPTLLRHPPVKPAPPPPLLLLPPPPLAATASLGLLSGWLSRQFSSRCRVPVASTSCRALAGASNK